MKRYRGFTLIELVIFIVITVILASTILLAFSSVLKAIPNVIQQSIANQTAQQCMEYFIEQRRVQGFSNVATGTTVPSFCTTPSGYTLSVNVATTTINTDSSYKTITVTVGGNGDAVLTTMIADY